jgi:hypothetical protein
MSRNTVDLTVLATLVLGVLAISFLAFSRPTIEIQLHDTYFVVDRFSLSILMLGPLILIVFLPIAALRNFRSVGTNVVLTIGLVLVGVMCYSVIELQFNYLKQVITLDDQGLPDDEPAADKIGQRINWTRGFLVVIGLAALALIYKTVKIWKEQTGTRSSL